MRSTMNLRTHRALQFNDGQGHAHIPYAYQVDSHTVKTHQGDFIQAFRFQGLAFETTDTAELNSWHEQLNMLIRNVSTPNLAIWSHLIRRESSVGLEGEFASDFALELNRAYHERLAGSGQLYLNELYLTLVHRPQPTSIGRLFGAAGSRLETGRKQLNSIAVRQLDDVAAEIDRSLTRYQPHRLGTYARGDFVFSEVCEFLQQLCDGSSGRFPLSRSDLRRTLLTARLLFGRETIELRYPHASRFAAALGIKEYPEASTPGLFNQLLGFSGELVLTQSFACLDEAAAKGALKRQRGRLEATEDDATDQIAELSEALNDLSSNRFTMGEHHWVLILKAAESASLQNQIAKARAVLSDSGCVSAREDLALEAAYWSQLPGNFYCRPRPAPITSRNFVGLAPLHSQPAGQSSGNHWGSPVTLLRTTSGSPYYFNYHVGELGTTLITGQSGSGKTALQNFLAAQAEKLGATGICLDKDCGSEIFIRACGGIYFSLKSDQPTGFNPFALAPTPEWLQLLRELIGVCIRQDDGAPLTARDQSDIAAAVAGVYVLPPLQRRFGQLLAFLPPSRQGNVTERLHRWCHSEQGAGTHAWVFDNPVDLFDLNKGRLFGFDYTDFIDNPVIRTPIMMYLWGRFASLIDGRRLYMFIDEFWKALEDDFFIADLQNRYKTMRKQNWFLICATQSPADALRSRIAHTVIEQTATFVFLPNPRGRAEDYVDGFGCSQREFEVLQGLGEHSRQFLVKQGQNSVVCELDLGGFNDQLAVLSGTLANNRLLAQLRLQLGDDPKAWLPEFYRRRGAP